MRILYGVAGEGMGHATRSHAFLADLVGEHDVLIVASGRAHDYLAQRFPQVREILGFSLAYEDNAIRRWETVAQNLRGARERLAGAGAHASTRWRATSSRTWWSATSRRSCSRWRAGERVPAISVDNIMMLDRCVHDEGIIGDDALDFELARQIARTKAPGLHWADRADLLPPAAAAQGDDPGRAGAAGGRARRRGGAGRAPARLPDRGRQRDPGPDAARHRPACRPTACAATSGGPRGRRAGLPAVQRDRVPRRPAHAPRRDRRRRLLAAVRVRVPAQAGALDPRRRAVRADARTPATCEQLGYGEYAEAPTPQAIGAFLERLDASISAASRTTDRTATTRRSRRSASSSSLVALERAGTARAARYGRGGPIGAGRHAAGRGEPALTRSLPVAARRRLTLAVARSPRRPHGARRDRDRGRLRLGPEPAHPLPGQRSVRPALRRSPSAASRSPATTC